MPPRMPDYFLGIFIRVTSSFLIAFSVTLGTLLLIEYWVQPIHPVSGMVVLLFAMVGSFWFGAKWGERWANQVMNAYLDQWSKYWIEKYGHRKGN